MAIKRRGDSLPLGNHRGSLSLEQVPDSAVEVFQRKMSELKPEEKEEEGVGVQVGDVSIPE